MKKYQKLFTKFIFSFVLLLSLIVPVSDLLAINPDNFTLSGGCYWDGPNLMVDVGIAGSVVPANADDFTLDVAWLNYDNIGPSVLYRVPNTGLSSINWRTNTADTPNNSPATPVNFKFRATARHNNGDGTYGSTATPYFYVYAANPAVDCVSTTPTCTDPTAQNYGGPEPCVPAASSCVETSDVTITGPSTLTAGQVGTFTATVKNTGNTRWYHGSYFKLEQQSGFTISPVYGHYSPAVPPNDTRVFTFSLTAPPTIGNYTFVMQNMHHAGAGYMLDSDGSTCAPEPQTNTVFGYGSKAFTVVPTLTTDVSLSSSSVRPDDSTTYNITVTGTNSSGASNISQMYALVNFQGANAGSYRGYVTLDAAAPWTGYQENMGCTLNGSAAPSGGYAAVQPGYGDSYIRLVSCAVTTSGNTKTTVFGVRWKSAFATNGPLTNNDISSLVMDQSHSWTNTGWINKDINFSIAGPSGTVTGPGSCTIGIGASTCSASLNWTLSNPIATPTTLGGVTVSNSLTASQSGSQSFSVPYGGQTYSLVSNSQTLASALVSSSCTGGSNWGGSSCVATPPTSLPLTISTSPSPRGYVSSTVGGINCGTLGSNSYSTCSTNINNGSTTALTASPASSYWKFTGWTVSNTNNGPATGECSGTGTCVLTITAAKYVIANFTTRSFNYTEF